MRETEKKRIQNNNQTKQSVRTPRRDNKLLQENGRKPSIPSKSLPKSSRSKPESNIVIGDTNMGNENVVINYVDDSYRSEDSVQCQEGQDRDLDNQSNNFRKSIQQTKGFDFDLEYVKDSASSNDSDENLDEPKVNDNKVNDMYVDPLSSESSDLITEALNNMKSSKSDNEKFEIMESKIEKLEDELRVVAALEISLYSMVPEHGSSAHKVHTPSRRLSRLYIHASKHWTKSKRAIIAKNTVSGLILVTRTCGNDVARLTFWLCNTIVLRELISQAFNISDQMNPQRFNVLNGNVKDIKGNFLLVKKEISSEKQVSEITQEFEDWEETSTYTTALEKIESWIFSRIVELVWWQALTPNMQSPVEELVKQKSIGKLKGPSLGDHQQGTLSIELWKSAFKGAFERLCPVRAAGHECGCLPILARMVMDQCVRRLDVAMFNAILRDSANQIPTDPVSDPIVDSRVLPIPAGEFSFGSGAQLKNSVGNWSKWLSDHLGNDSNDDPTNTNDENGTHIKTKCFCLLDELSDLLMLPKDMLIDCTITEEVCPSINLGVIKRILCYFTPDEFCPDPVPGEVLEALNSESYAERKLAEESSRSFPYTAPIVTYTTPLPSEIAEKVGEAGEKSRKVERNVSMVQRKGYMSDEDLEDLDSPLESFIEKSSPRFSENGNVGLNSKKGNGCKGNVRYELLHEVWSL